MTREREFTAGPTQRLFKDSEPAGVMLSVKDENGNTVLTISGEEQTLVKIAGEAVASALNKAMR